MSSPDPAVPPRPLPFSGHRNRRLSSRGRVVLVVTGVALVVLVLSLRAIARTYTDFLWFDALDYASIWRTLVGTKVALVVVFSLAFFVLAWVNLSLADRLNAGLDEPDDELLVRYREIVEPRRRLLRAVTAGLLALVAGAGAAGQWNNWLLFRHGRDFGRLDPLLGNDVGFYVFRFPFLSYCVSWAFASITIVLLATAVTHYLGGGLRPSAPKGRVLPGARVHLTILLAVAAVLKAVDYLMSRYALTLSDRGKVNGATYTDVNAQLPAIWLLVAISLCAAVLLLLSVRTRNLTLPVVAVGSWLLVAIVAGEAYPWFVQRFQVKPKESASEAPFIKRNIEATRAALGIDRVVSKSFDYVDQPTDAEITQNADTIRNIRLLDPKVSLQAFQNLEGELNYFQFRSLDSDRYVIDGSETEVILGVRELEPSRLPQDTWEARHVIYTHGYGLAVAPANAVDTNGAPRFVTGGVPARASAPDVLTLTRPEVYFGEGLDGATSDGYAIVGTTRKEQTSPGLETEYQGTGGVSAKGFMRRAAFALRFGELDPLISDYLTPESRVLYLRDISDRVRAVAPFLAIDHDPYPVVADGHIKWVLDAYTTSASYPYAQRVDTSTLPDSSDLKGRSFNYIRNSVKAVVDAYDGTVELYLTDELYGQQDPIVRSYAAAFPNLFKPLAEMPQVIRDHLRYPTDMFQIQTEALAKYHVEDPGEFYSASDYWDIAQDPGTLVNEKSDAAGGTRRLTPFHEMMKLPDSERVGFTLFRPFVPYSEQGTKKELTAFMVGQSDGSDYGRLEVYTMTQAMADGTQVRNRSVAGPLIVDSNIKGSTNGSVSQTLTLLNAGGSKVEFGTMVIIPIADGLLYIRPTYVSAAAADSIPELRNVIVATGKRVEVGRTLQEALEKLFPTADVSTLESAPSSTTNTSQPATPAQPTTPGSTLPGSTPPGTSGSDPAQLLTRAITLFDEADRALREGGSQSLSVYQAKTTEAQELIRQASIALGGAPDTTTTAPTSVPGGGG